MSIIGEDVRDVMCSREVCTCCIGEAEVDARSVLVEVPRAFQIFLVHFEENYCLGLEYVSSKLNRGLMVPRPCSNECDRLVEDVVRGIEPSVGCSAPCYTLECFQCR